MDKEVKNKDNKNNVQIIVERSYGEKILTEIYAEYVAVKLKERVKARA